MLRKLTFIIIAFFLILPFVNAESGSVTINDASTVNYNTTTGLNPPAAPDIILFPWSKADYGQLTFLSVKSNLFSFSKSGGTSKFHCDVIGGFVAQTTGSTCTGTFAYDDSTKTMTWWFDDTSYLNMSSSVIGLTYNTSSITSEVTIGGVYDGAAPSASVPVGLYHPTTGHIAYGQGGSGNYITYTAVVRNQINNTYEVTYSQANATITLFSWIINKTPANGRNSKVYVNGSNSLYAYEGAFNHNFYNGTAQYNDGIIMRFVASSGNFALVNVNLTNSGAPNPTGGNASGGSPSGQIYYDFTNATINSAYGINVSLADANFTTVLGVPVNYYRIRVYDTIGNEIDGSPISFSTQQYNTTRLWKFLALGTYHANVTTCSKILCLESVIDTASMAISQQQYNFSVTSEASSYSAGDTIHFVVTNPSPSTTYFNVFLLVGGQNPIVDLPIFPGSVRYVNLSVTGDMLFGDWNAELDNSIPHVGAVANKFFTIGNCVPGTRVCIRWDINNLIGQTNNLYFTTNQNTSTVTVYKPILGTNSSGIADNFTVNPADSFRAFLMDTVGNWNATIYDNGNASNTSYANITVLASLEKLGCNPLLPNYVCWNNATYFAGDAFVINYKDTAISPLPTTLTAHLVIYDPTGAMKFSNDFCDLGCPLPFSGSAPGAFSVNAMPGKWHAAIVHGGTNASSFTDGTIIADSYAVVSTQPSPTTTIPTGSSAISGLGNNLLFLISTVFFWGLMLLLGFAITVYSGKFPIQSHQEKAILGFAFIEDMGGLFAPYTIPIFVVLVIIIALTFRKGKETVTGE